METKGTDAPKRSQELGAREPKPKATRGELGKLQGQEEPKVNPEEEED